MKSVQWKTYRTRFLVKAKQLSSNLTFTDHLGRQHCGRKGDYLVESCDGVLSIAPRRIFEDVYVPMRPTTDLSEIQSASDDNVSLNGFRAAPLRIDKIETDFRDDEPQPSINIDRMPRVRKSPQPVRVTTSRLSLM